MSKAPSMPVFTDALIGDTTHLSMEEFGAYCMILFVTWRNNAQPLPDDAKRMARICRVSEKRWTEKLRPLLVEFFDLSEGTWRQGRLEKEWAYLRDLRSAKSENGKKGGRPKGAENEKMAGDSDATSHRNIPSGDDAKSLENNDTDKAVAFSQLKLEQSTHTQTQEKEDSVEAVASTGAGGAMDHEPSEGELVWGPGLEWLAQAAKKSPTSLRSMVGRWCKGGRESLVLNLMRECRQHSPPIAEPISWIEAAIADRSKPNDRFPNHRPDHGSRRTYGSDGETGRLAILDALGPELGLDPRRAAAG